jgi:cold shock protein
MTAYDRPRGGEIPRLFSWVRRERLSRMWCLMSEGTIKKIMDKGFGFIDTGRGEIFFHSSNVDGGKFNELQEGQKVSFTEGRGPKGPRAENVKPV